MITFSLKSRLTLLNVNQILRMHLVKYFMLRTDQKYLITILPIHFIEIREPFLIWWSFMRLILKLSENIILRMVLTQKQMNLFPNCLSSEKNTNQNTILYKTQVVYKNLKKVPLLLSQEKLTSNSPHNFATFHKNNRENYNQFSIIYKTTTSFTKLQHKNT